MMARFGAGGFERTGMIEFRDVCHEYRLGVERVHALKGVNFSIPEGDFVACMGPSGSGKSTLLHLVAGLMKPTAGRVFLNDRDITHLPDKQMSGIRNELIGYVFQFFNLQSYYTAVENVELPLIFRELPRAERLSRARAALAEVGLSERENHSPNEMSGGEMQRVSVARALVTEPRVLLADEPTGNLDRANGLHIMELLQEINQRRNLTIMMVTHDTATTGFAKRTVHLDQGELKT
jgi:putative ABC transport system ATP-binding protein